MRRALIFSLFMVLFASPAMAVDFFVEGFDSGLGDWTVTDNTGGGGGVWTDDNSGGIFQAGYPYTNLDQNIAIADSDALGFGGPAFDTTLTSPVRLLT